LEGRGGSETIVKGIKAAQTASATTLIKHIKYTTKSLTPMPTQPDNNPTIVANLLTAKEIELARKINLPIEIKKYKTSLIIHKLII